MSTAVERAVREMKPDLDKFGITAEGYVVSNGMGLGYKFTPGTPKRDVKKFLRKYILDIKEFMAKERHDSTQEKLL